jgi:hypothetical protein
LRLRAFRFRAARRIGFVSPAFSSAFATRTLTILPRAFAGRLSRTYPASPSPPTLSHRSHQSSQFLCVKLLITVFIEFLDHAGYHLSGIPTTLLDAFCTLPGSFSPLSLGWCGGTINGDPSKGQSNKGNRSSHQESPNRKW